LGAIVQLSERQKWLSVGYRRWMGDEALRDVQRRIDQRVASRAGAGMRGRKVGIVALARRLAIAFWQFLEDGLVPEGATVKG
jgi:hypothetical protein